MRSHAGAGLVSQLIILQKDHCQAFGIMDAQPMQVPIVSAVCICVRCTGISDHDLLFSKPAEELREQLEGPGTMHPPGYRSGRITLLGHLQMGLLLHHVGQLVKTHVGSAGDALLDICLTDMTKCSMLHGFSWYQPEAPMPSQSLAQDEVAFLVVVFRFL